jgi:hypothetical protein
MKNSLRGGLVTALTAGALLILPMSNGRVTRAVSRTAAEQSNDPKTLYEPQQKVFWLTADEFGYIRPGLHVTVNSITIGGDLKAVVDLSYTDDLGQPLDRNGKITAGSISTSFILAWWDPSPATTRPTPPACRRARSPARPPRRPARTRAGPSPTSTSARDVQVRQGGPAGYDVTATTTLGIYATRNMAEIQDKNYYANVEQDFVPNGSAVTRLGA